MDTINKQMMLQLCTLLTKSYSLTNLCVGICPIDNDILILISSCIQLNTLKIIRKQENGGGFSQLDELGITIFCKNILLSNTLLCLYFEKFDLTLWMSSIGTLKCLSSLSFICCRYQIETSFFPFSCLYNLTVLDLRYCYIFKDELNILLHCPLLNEIKLSNIHVRNIEFQQFLQMSIHPFLLQPSLRIIDFHHHKNIEEQKLLYTLINYRNQHRSKQLNKLEIKM
jgi:hypothetical protein